MNTGTDAWDPSRVHLSYHWLWLVPRELAFRSRTLPYQDGIRTELGAPVPPGGRVAVDGRLLAPAVPGVYWLQWDMVEEGVTWFVQVSPRQPRHLVVILPTAAEFFAPLPLLVALAGCSRSDASRAGRRIGLCWRRSPRAPTSPGARRRSSPSRSCSCTTRCSSRPRSRTG